MGTTLDFNGLKAVARSVKVSVSGQYQAEVVFIKGNGVVTADATDANLDLVIAILKTPVNKLEIKMKSFKLDYDLSTHIDGTHDVFLASVVFVAKSKIKSIIADAIKNVIEEQLSKVNSETLADFP